MKNLPSQNEISLALEGLRSDVLFSIIEVCKLAKSHIEDIGAGIEIGDYRAEDNPEYETSRSLLNAVANGAAAAWQSKTEINAVTRALMGFRHDINERQVTVVVDAMEDKNPKEAFAKRILGEICPQADFEQFYEALFALEPSVQSVGNDILIFKHDLAQPGNALSHLFNRLRMAKAQMMNNAENPLNEAEDPQEEGQDIPGM